MIPDPREETKPVPETRPTGMATSVLGMSILKKHNGGATPAHHEKATIVYFKSYATATMPSRYGVEIRPSASCARNCKNIFWPKAKGNGVLIPVVTCGDVGGVGEAPARRSTKR